MRNLKTNVSIKFNSIEEYREIEKKLIELGYEYDEMLSIDVFACRAVKIYVDKTFCHYPLVYTNVDKKYNLLQEFLNDIK